MLLGVEARLAKTDAMLLLTVVAAMGAMARVYLLAARRGSGASAWSCPAIFWTALAGGILLKGPLILMFVGLTIARSRSSTARRWLLAAAAGLGPDVARCVLVLPWFVAISGARGDTFFAESVGGDLLQQDVGAGVATARRPGSICCCSG